MSCVSTEKCLARKDVDPVRRREANIACMPSSIMSVYLALLFRLNPFPQKLIRKNYCRPAEKRRRLWMLNTCSSYILEPSQIKTWPKPHPNYVNLDPTKIMIRKPRPCQIWLIACVAAECKQMSKWKEKVRECIGSWLMRGCRCSLKHDWSASRLWSNQSFDQKCLDLVRSNGLPAICWPEWGSPSQLRLQDVKQMFKMLIDDHALICRINGFGSKDKSAIAQKVPQPKDQA